MDQQAATLLATLKKASASSDTKVGLLNALKSDIKHYRVPDTAQGPIFEVIKLAITQQASSTLVSTAFSTLGHLLKRLKIQDASGYAIKQFAPRLFGSLQERLGDLREPVRVAASQALGDVYQFLPSEVEEVICNGAIEGQNVRAKEMAIQWVVRMHQDEAMPFKSYVGPIVARLEDADGGVRDTAKTALIELFRDAPDRAKMDLKRQLKAYGVRISIESQILAQISGPQSSKQNAPTLHSPGAETKLSIRSQPPQEVHAPVFDHDAARPPPADVVPMDPLFVHTARELEDIFRDMGPPFEGKETEQNWMLRDKSISKIRRLLKGNAASEYHQVFMAGLKGMTEGIIKVSTSLRTTTSTNACQLVQELAATLGPALDSQAEMFLQTYIKMSAATKHIASENGRITTDAIFQNCSYHLRSMQHIWTAAQEKNATVRQCVPEWLETVLKRQAAYKQQFDSSGGLALAEKCIKKGLDDANPKVKEKMRAVYWTLAKHWPDKAEGIISKLDPKSKAALEKDQHNPHAALHGGTLSASTQSLRTAGTSSRTTLREVMAEQRKAKAGAFSSRPNSAMASMTPAKVRSEANLRSAARQQSNLSHSTRSAAPVQSSAPVPNNDPVTSNKRSALMSGPVRRPRRQEIQRPQTADPYASRRLLRPETPASVDSPAQSPPKDAERLQASTSSIGLQNSRSNISHHESGTLNGSPNYHGAMRQNVLSPGSSSHSRPSSKYSDTADGDFGTAAPSNRFVNAQSRQPGLSSHKRPGQALSVDRGTHQLGDEDEFAMNMASRSPNRVSLPYQSPLKAMFEEAREKLEKSRSPPRDDEMLDEMPRSVFRGGVRAESPTKSGTPQPMEVQVYEDPFTSDTADVPTDGQRKVLGELPVNEQITMHSPSRSPTEAIRPGSPRRLMMNNTSQDGSATPDRAEVMRNRRLLSSGIERIRSRNLDAHGFRRVQELAKSPLDIWDDGQRYDDLMAAVLDFLQTFERDARITSLASSKTQGLKAQALGLVRALLTIHRKYAATWLDKALTTVLHCRNQVDGTSHVLTDLDRLSEEIIKQAVPISSVETILEYLATVEKSTEQDSSEPSRSIAMALILLRSCVQKVQPLPVTTRTQLTQTTARFLDAENAEVRKADVELASELFELFGQSKTEFWNEFKGIDEGRLGLLTYYIARKAKTH